MISLPSSLFANFAAVEADIQSSGANTVITLDANDTHNVGEFLCGASACAQFSFHCLTGTCQRALTLGASSAEAAIRLEEAFNRCR